MLHRDAHDRLRGERDIAGQHLVEKDAERVDVGARIDAASHGLLRGDVVGRPEHAPGLGEPVGLQRASDAEVRHLRPALGVDQYVLRLHVAVNEAPSMGGRKPASDLDRVGRGLVDGQRPHALDPLLERLTVYVLEDDVGVAAILAGVDHGNDVRMGELRDGAGFTAEALDLVRLVGHLAVHHLHRDPALQRAVPRQVHRGHPAAAQLGFEPVALREYGADQAAR